VRYIVTRRTAYSSVGQVAGAIEADSVVIDPDYNNLEFYTDGRLIGGVNSGDWVTFVEEGKGQDIK
jgi:hypothetical protein